MWDKKKKGKSKPNLGGPPYPIWPNSRFPLRGPTLHSPRARIALVSLQRGTHLSVGSGARVVLLCCADNLVPVVGHPRIGNSSREIHGGERAPIVRSSGHVQPPKPSVQPRSTT
jgi:hypothetical protein